MTLNDALSNLEKALQTKICHMGQSVDANWPVEVRFAEKENLSWLLAQCCWHPFPPRLPEMLEPRPICFVIQSVGREADPKSGRTLDLDSVYAMIRAAVEEVGLECCRADIGPSEDSIERQVSELLLTANLAIADLSASDARAYYHLGLRHGLRAAPTILVAEAEFEAPFPFDRDPFKILPYRHPGSNLGAEEERRFQAELRKEIERVLDGRGGTEGRSWAAGGGGGWSTSSV